MPLDVEQIKQRTNDKTYKRGLDIYRQQNILDPALRGNILEGYYQGSGLNPYHLQIEIDGDAIRSATCDCGYKRGDDCKHVVALLTTYIMEPDVFAQQAERDDPLLQLNKDELLNLVQQMIHRYPDLQELIENPDEIQEANQVVDIEPYRHQLHEVLHHDVRSRYAAEAVYDLLETAERLAEQNNWRSAVALYQAIMDEAIQPDHYAFDDEGKLVRALSEVLAGLTELLPYPTLLDAHADRYAILQTLFKAYVWEQNTRWEDLSEHVPEIILTFATPDDLDKMREQISFYKDESLDQGHLQIASRYGSFLTYLEAQQKDPTSTLPLLLEQKLYTLAFYRNLLLELIPSATEIVRQYLDDNEFLQAVAILDQQNKAEIALGLAENRLKNRFDDGLAAWLIQYYREVDNYTRALQLQRQRMLHNPRLGNYLQLKEIALILGQWADIEPRILRWLDEQGHYERLTEIYLEESHWGEAWDALAKTELSDWRYRELAFAVAEQSRFAEPEQAVQIYMEQANIHISAKKRHNYQIAVEYLQEARKLYTLLDRLSEWDLEVEVIRAKYKRLTALQEELTNAGL